WSLAPATAPLASPTVWCSSRDPAPPEIYTLSLHDALPISCRRTRRPAGCAARWRRRRATGGRLVGRPPTARPTWPAPPRPGQGRSEEHTSELQSLTNLVCRLLLAKKKLWAYRSAASRPAHG